MGIPVFVVILRYLNDKTYDWRVWWLAKRITTSAVILSEKWPLQEAELPIVGRVSPSDDGKQLQLRKRPVSDSILVHVGSWIRRHDNGAVVFELAEVSSETLEYHPRNVAISHIDICGVSWCERITRVCDHWYRVEYGFPSMSPREAAEVLCKGLARNIDKTGLCH